MNIENNQDNNIPGQLTERIIVNWSQPRCWHGDTVTIRVRTDRVPDGYLVRLRIRAVAGAQIEQLVNQPIANNKLDIPYTLDWKTKLPQPAPYPALFEVEAMIAVLNITAVSGPLAVDLIPPLFSA